MDIWLGKERLACTEVGYLDKKKKSEENKKHENENILTLIANTKAQLN